MRTGSQKRVSSPRSRKTGSALSEAAAPSSMMRYSLTNHNRTTNVSEQQPFQYKYFGKCHSDEGFDARQRFFDRYHGLASSSAMRGLGAAGGG